MKSRFVLAMMYPPDAESGYIRPFKSDSPLMMENPAPDPAPDPVPDPAAAPQDAEADKAARLASLTDRLAQRAAAHAAQQANASAASETPAPTTTKRSGVVPPQLSAFWQSLSWNLRLFVRWTRPRLEKGLILLLAVVLRLAIRLYHRFLEARVGPRLLAVLREWAIWSGHKLEKLGAHLRGWMLWQWREVKRNPDRRLAVLGLMGGFVLPLLVIITLAHVMPPSDDPVAAYIDASVPAPEANFIEALPGEDRSVEDTMVTSGPQETLTANNFRFEAFVRRDESGKLQLLSHVAEHYMNQWYPRGTPAVEFMRFFGRVMQRANGGTDMALAARERCLSMPTTKVFTERTVTCTYGHTLPQPLHTRESPNGRVFWIVALSFDRQNRLTDLRIHARLTQATN